MSMDSELRQDIKEIHADIAEMRTDIALIKQTLETKKEDKKIRASVVVALIGLFSGMGGALITALFRS